MSSDRSVSALFHCFVPRAVDEAPGEGCHLDFNAIVLVTAPAGVLKAQIATQLIFEEFVQTESRRWSMLHFDTRLSTHSPQ